MDMSKNKNYFEVEALNHSRLKLIDYGYNKYLEGYDGESPNMREGTALHRYFLEPETVNEVVEVNEVLKHKKTYKTFNDTVKTVQANESDVLIVPDGYKKTLNRYDKNLHDTAREYLEGKKEVEIYKTINGRKRKCKIDIVGNERIVDFKTISSYDKVFKGGTARDWYFKNYSYHSQLAFYAEMLGDFREVYIVALFLDLGEWVVFDLGDLLDEGYELNKSRLLKLDTYETFGFEALHEGVVKL